MGQNTTYKAGAHIVVHINVVNDTAERDVKHIEEYNSILTKDEEQKTILTYYKLLKITKKSTLIATLR